jgi:hypothetical protein
MGAIGVENAGVTWMEAMHKEVKLLRLLSLTMIKFKKILLK